MIYKTTLTHITILCIDTDGLIKTNKKNKNIIIAKINSYFSVLTFVVKLFVFVNPVI